MLNPAPMLEPAGGANASCTLSASREPKRTGTNPILPQCSGLANRESLPMEQTLFVDTQPHL